MRIKSLQPPTHSFWRDTRRWLGSRRGFRQFLLAAAVGFAITSGLAVAYERGALESIVSPIRSLFLKVGDTVKADLVTNDLPTIYLDIAFEAYQVMAAQRDQALQAGILLLSAEDWQPAEIRFQSETIPVRVRLKGDWIDHLGADKWSFRIETRRDAVLMGMRSFSIPF